MSHQSISQYTKTLINNYFSTAPSLALAVSGGSDSMCLLHAIQSIWREQQWDLSTIHILTCDHNTRENIQKEIDLVASVRHGSSMEVFHYGWSDDSEQSLRQRRHEQFVNYCHQHNISFLLTWHHLDDRIETTLLNMKRGTNINGISSISVSDSHFLDPNITLLRTLINHTKEEIIQYCNDNHIPYLNDPTNTDISYSERNRMRILIQEYLSTPQFYTSFNNLYAFLEDHNQTNITREQVTIMPQDTHDLITIPSGSRTPNHMYKLYKYYNISINPRSTTLDNLCKQLNSKSGNKIFYQGLTLTAYSYASIAKQKNIE